MMEHWIKIEATPICSKTGVMLTYAMTYTAPTASEHFQLNGWRQRVTVNFVRYKPRPTDPLAKKLRKSKGSRRVQD